MMRRSRAGLEVDAPARTPQLDDKEREVVDRLSALLQADEARAAGAVVVQHRSLPLMRACSLAQLLPPATKLATVAASRAQFAAVREKILGAASLQVGDAHGNDAGGMHHALGSALCAAGVDDDAEKDGDDDEPGEGLAPAGAADSDQEGSAEAGRRTRVRMPHTARCRHVC